MAIVVLKAVTMGMKMIIGVLGKVGSLKIRKRKGKRRKIQKKKSEKQVVTEKEVITTSLRQRYSNAYMTQTFGIPEEQVNDFIYFTEPIFKSKSISSGQSNFFDLLTGQRLGRRFKGVEDYRLMYSRYKQSPRGRTG